MKRRAFLSAAGRSAAGLLGSSRLFAAARPPIARPVRYIERWSWAMGQPVHLQLFHPSEDAGYEAAQAAFTELRRIEARLSRFDDASDLNELNRQAGTGWIALDADLHYILRAATRYRRTTGGAFDVAVEPLMRTWGFREPRKTVPGTRELAAARAALAATTMEVEGHRARLGPTEAALDLGGIGVGYGLDRAAEVLRDHGVSAALLDVSGDLLAIGAPPGAEGWMVDIVDPRLSGGVLATALLRDEALATSAMTRDRVLLGGVRRGHVLDPHHGAPVQGRVQATVIAPSGIAADVLSTALLAGGQWSPGIRRHWLVPLPA
ncbi:MAG: FAD:protein FMN transferase [Gemmatimonadales bacterium]